MYTLTHTHTTHTHTHEHTHLAVDAGDGGAPALLGARGGDDAGTRDPGAATRGRHVDGAQVGGDQLRRAQGQDPGADPGAERRI